MSSKQDDAFTWKKWKHGSLPELEPHSEAKLRVLSDYVEDYITILCSRSFGQDTFRITLVDGFAGGGIYESGKQGSPFILLQAVEAAEAKLNAGGRQKRIHIDCHYHFIDEKKEACECLRFQFEQSQYKHRLGKDIFLHKGKFEECCPSIVDRLQKRHPKAGARVIFFLDQCGYTQVPPAVLRSISEQLNHKAEFIINFAIKWLSDIIGNNKTFLKVFPTLGLEGHLSADTLIRAKEKDNVHWKYVVESLIGPAFRNAAGSPFFSPFYIEPIDSHRGYWLLHLAPHERARSAMLDVYWKNANSHRHFGHPGLNMLAYKADADQTGYMEGMSFDDFTRTEAKKKLLEDFARVFHDSHSDGVTFEQFAKLYSNKTIANSSLMVEVINELAIAGEVEVKGPKGSEKRSQRIQARDIILPCNQLLLSLPGSKQNK